MRYSVELTYQIYFKCCGFVSFAKNIGKSMSKHLISKYGRKLLGTTKKSVNDALKTARKTLIQKTAETTGD